MVLPDDRPLSQRSSQATKPAGSMPPVLTGDVPPEERVRVFLQNMMEMSGYELWAGSLLRNDVHFISVSSSPTSTTTFTYTVQPEHSNRHGNLHGGCIATIFDILTTTSLLPLARPGYWEYAGVTRNLSITCLRPAAIGEKLRIRSEVVQAGRRMCTLKGEMRRHRDNVLVAVGEHGKVAVGERGDKEGNDKQDEVTESARPRRGGGGSKL